MKKIFLLIGTALLVGCVTNGNPTTKPFNSSECGDVGGYTQTKVTYGDDGINMKKLSKVRVNTEFRIKLKPKPKEDWQDVNVCAKGDTAKSDDNADWIDGCGRANDLPNGWFVAGCVPEVDL